VTVAVPWLLQRTRPFRAIAITMFDVFQVACEVTSVTVPVAE